MKKIYITLFVLIGFQGLFLSIAHSSENLLENRISKFVPDNYIAFDIIPGNLNRDSIQDIILILAPHKEAEISNSIEEPIDNPKTKRPLMLLLGQNDGSLKLAAKNDNAVYCLVCGGIIGDPYTQVVIKNGFFTIEHYGGSAWRWTRLITFKYANLDKSWYLHRDGGESFHINEPEKTEKNMKTKKDFGKIRFDKYNIYEE